MGSQQVAHGVGARVSIYEAGKAGQKEALLGTREIAVGFGYASGQEAAAHFGLGKAEKVDIEVLLPHGNGKHSKQNIAANQRVTLP